MSAIAMDNESREILSVYHQHADCDPEVDSFCRKYIHGLNPEYLHRYGFRNECALVADFQRWLTKFKVVLMLANNPAKERKLLGNVYVEDILLPDWVHRQKALYHTVSRRFKELNLPIRNVRCDAYIHNCYVDMPRYTRGLKESEVMKLLHGRHCSLYDTYEMYLFYVCV